MSDLLDELERHLDGHDARVADQVLRSGAAYSGGDAFAGSKLDNIPPEGYERLTDLFREAGIDATFRTRMDVVSFVNDPDTGHERLDEAIEDL